MHLFYVHSDSPHRPRLILAQGSKCPSLPGFTHWVKLPVNPGKPGLGFKPYFGKSGEYWVIKYFKCLDVQNCANLWILRQVRLLDNKNIEHIYEGRLISSRNCFITEI